MTEKQRKRDRKLSSVIVVVSVHVDRPTTTKKAARPFVSAYHAWVMTNITNFLLLLLLCTLCDSVVYTNFFVDFYGFFRYSVRLYRLLRYLVLYVRIFALRGTYYCYMFGMRLTRNGWPLIIIPGRYRPGLVQKCDHNYCWRYSNLNIKL